MSELEGKATGLLSAAEKYDLKVGTGTGTVPSCHWLTCPQELKTMCETALCDTITQDNVLGSQPITFLMISASCFCIS